MNPATRPAIRPIEVVYGGQQSQQQPKRIRLEQETAALVLATLADPESRLITPKIPTDTDLILDQYQVLRKKLTGTFKTKNPIGFIYEGEFKGGKPHGKGKAYYPRGELWIEGEFKAGKVSGQGKVYGPSGNLEYEGEFKEGTVHGKGTSYNRDGKLAYEGEIKEGRAHGKGTSYNRDGKLEYEGEFKDGKFDGQGTRYDDDGNPIEKGLFENDLFIGNPPTDVNVPGKVVPLPAGKKEKVKLPAPPETPRSTDQILDQKQLLQKKLTGNLKFKNHVASFYQGKVKYVRPSGKMK